MITQIIDAAIKHRLIVLLLSLILAVVGVRSLQQTPLDAIPDLTDTQVIVRSDFAGASPRTVENLVTYPLSTTMLGLAGVKDVRAYSMFGSSFVYVIFHDDIDPYWARSRVVEALNQMGGVLPEGVKTRIGPDATGVGWVYQYALIDKSNTHDLSELRSLQDWYLRYELSSVEGVSEVASVGGFVREYQVSVDPKRLQAYGLDILHVSRVLQDASREVGGRVIEQGGTELMVRSDGLVQRESDLAALVVGMRSGIPLTLGDIARIQKGPALRRGIAELDGEGEVAAGIVIMRSSENALRVIERVKAKLETLKAGLPEGVEIVTVYDRSPLIADAVSYLERKLIEEALVVALVTLLFLLHVRSALVAIITLPLGVLAAFIVMHLQGISANIMSLGGIAIAIGAMVDAAIVMVENVHRKLSELPSAASEAERRDTMVTAMKEVAPGLFFSLLVITVSFIPVFALGGESYRLFSPLAFTKTYAMAAAALLSVTLIPVLMLYLVRGRFVAEARHPLNRFFIALYRPLLRVSLRFGKTTLLLALILFLSTLYPLSKLGSEFMPPLYEGELLYMPTTLPLRDRSQKDSLCNEPSHQKRSRSGSGFR